MPSRAPSYKGLKPASPTTSRIKSRNRAVDTAPEVLLRKTLWAMGFRYRKNVATLPGKPDIVFPRVRVAIFCDGDFWHGRDWPAREAKLSQGTNAAYWRAKIRANMDRDLRNTALLEKAGWRVIRLWETEVKRDPECAACKVANVLRSERPTSSIASPPR